MAAGSEEQHVPKEKDLLYLSAAEYVNKRIDAQLRVAVTFPLPLGGHKLRLTSIIT